MRLIKKYDDFKATGKTKKEVEEKPHQKSDEESKHRRRTDNTPPQKAAIVTIPDWKTY